MPRPIKPRFVAGAPAIEGFSPKGMAPRGQVVLTVEGFEALRLSDFEHLDQAAAAEIMGVSRQTYGRILGQARSLVCDALVTGKEILIDGGHFELRGEGWGRGWARGQGGGRGRRGRREVTDMPGKDRTGPDGQGAGTGRGRGGCGQGAGRGGNSGQGAGQGAGRGRGQGRGGGGGQGGGRRRG